MSATTFRFPLFQSHKFLTVLVFLGLGFSPLSVFAKDRLIQNLDAPWQFIRAESSENLSSLSDFMSWKPVSLPHTYNALDGADGGGYYRGAAWYKTTFNVPFDRKNQRTFIEFDGAATVADVWVNGNSVGRHVGGYARFRFDITAQLKNGENTISVRTSNAKTTKAPPIGGDFTVFGGLYRNVRLVTTADIHFDMLDFGGKGVYLKADKVLSQDASLTATARIANDSSSTAKISVRLSLIDSEGKSVQTDVTKVSLKPKTIVPVELTLNGLIPHLWDGVKDPYLYSVKAELINENTRTKDTVDDVTQLFGFRDIRIDNSSGLTLNGRLVPIHGVNLFHSGRPEKGLAVNDADIDQDLKILREMGVNGIRLVHFQHPPHTYDEADRLGYLIWTEIPLNGAVDPGQEFAANAEQQLRELIRQNYSHPSVMVWGLGNEVYKSDADSNRIFDQLQLVAHSEDPHRPTIYAHCCSSPDAPHAKHTDIIGFNIYNGWYPDQKGSMGDWADRAHALLKDKVFAISEYGAGASVLQQEESPKNPTPDSYWHPEQYQAQFHENSWRQLREKPYLWGNFIWVAFDLASDGRHEGDRDGINDKGLVTYDRLIRKDAYYWYQVNWTDKPAIYITSRRFTQRSTSPVTIKVYSNLAKIKLTVNGVILPEATVVDHIAQLDKIVLRPGSNEIVASDAVSTSGAEDRVNWIYETNAENSRKK